MIQLTNFLLSLMVLMLLVLLFQLENVNQKLAGIQAATQGSNDKLESIRAYGIELKTP